ncbi:MAG: hypothetical protein EOM14_10825 [Clostridia bacterium]|nr:hypothetical protein [Clostridia bacterium]
MLDAVIDALTEVLTEGGISAVRRFPAAAAELSAGVVCVSIDGGRSISPGFGDYIGVRVNDDGGETELFGRRLEFDARFEIIWPFAADLGAKSCAECADEVMQLLGTLPGGMRATEISRGEVTEDETLAAFRCICTLRCTAYFVAERGGDDTAFTDFVLKGAVGNADK